MKIEHSAVALNAAHVFASEHEVTLDTSASFRSIQAALSRTAERVPGGGRGQQTELLLLLTTLIDRMLELFPDRKGGRVIDLRELLQADAPVRPENRVGNGAGSGDAGGGGRAPAVEIEWTREYTEKIRESERTEFASTGKIQTADGRVLDFSLELDMCRRFECERKVTTVEKTVLRDPLVINFEGRAAELSGKRFAFDLDADGTDEMIDGLGRCSGYLAIDNNGDGCINDGSELFGTRSGNGFADLALLDDDGNRWLDEADAAFDRLRVWQHDASGEGHLTSLRENGVGALYLGSVETPFALTDSENRVLASVRASGVYLCEDGGVGTLQQVDLAV
jgi:hypothetical protein